MRTLYLYTDGSGTTRGNPGGYAYLLVDLEAQTIVWAGGGAERDMTNNRAELMALIQGLHDFRAFIHLMDCGTIETAKYKLQLNVVVRTDSQYVLGLAKHEYQPIANLDLVQELQDQIRLSGIPLTFEHVRGHADDRFNQMVDRMANLKRLELLDTMKPEVSDGI
jgi:ribonuclease HI